MKKKVFGKKLSRDVSARRDLIRSLIKGLVEHGLITTTKQKAKMVRNDIEKMVVSAKEGSISSRRRVFSFLGNDRKTTDKLFGVIAKEFKDRKSGFTRIVSLAERKGDLAQMVRFEWSQKMAEVEKEKAVSKKAEVEKKKVTKEKTQNKNK